LENTKKTDQVYSRELAVINNVRAQCGLEPVTASDLRAANLEVYRGVPAAVMNIAFASAVKAVSNKYPDKSFSEGRILVPAINLLIKNDLRLRVYNDNGLASKSLESMPTSILGNIIPATVLMNSGDPAQVVGPHNNILGYFCVAKPRVTQVGSFQATISVAPTSNPQVGTPYVLNPTPYSVRVEGSAIADINNTGAFFLPLPFKATVINYNGVATDPIVEQAESESASIIGLANGGFTVDAGDNLHLDVYPVPATKEVQIMYIQALAKKGDTHVELFKLMVSALLENGNPLSC
jgi:hypothetical protein